MRRVLITGGSGGIGSAIARVCAARGFWPIVAYSRNHAGALDVVRECGVGETLRLDLLDEEWDLEAAGDVDSVVHCAGLYSRQRSLIGSDPRELLKLLEVNALGPLRLTQTLIKVGAPLTHSIVLLSTAMSCRGGGPYALSKAAALAACKLLAGELEPRGIRVHAVVPGWTETAMASAAATASGRTLEDIRSGHPDNHLLQPEEIGQLVLELLLDTETYVEGQLILWDLRDSREPVWATLKDALSFNTTHTTS
jgi:NAD(P)-dependent dehydrogenase (short-subunit alcohol dehydrogenase family)